MVVQAAVGGAGGTARPVGLRKSDVCPQMAIPLSSHPFHSLYWLGRRAMDGSLFILVRNRTVRYVGI
jgi:hypothetical protein